MGSVGRVHTQSALLFTAEEPLVLASGATLGPVEVAYETYGELLVDAATGQSNAVFVCHAISGDAHAAGHHGDPSRPGWWDSLIGPGEALDTDERFVVCANLLGGCQGTTGPASPDPDRPGQPYGSRFPDLSIGDLVTVHRALCRHLGIGRLAAAIGGSMGGMQVVEWARVAPGELAAAIVVAASGRLSAQNIGFSYVARQAIMRDAHFAGGDFYATGRRPDDGLAIARMVGHITYLSEADMERRFPDRRQVGSYLDHQGAIFVARFDANTYLVLSRTMDTFDLLADPGALAGLGADGPRFLVLSFDSDWRFPTAHSVELAAALRAAGATVTATEISAPNGHDSFLMAIPAYHAAIRAFLAG